MRLRAQFVDVLLLVGFVGVYSWWIFAVLAAVALVYFARRWWLARRQRVAEREAAHAAIGARADKQHTWVLASDDRAPGSIRTYDAGFNSRPISAIAVRSRLLLQENDIRILTRVVISHGFAFVLAHKYE